MKIGCKGKIAVVAAITAGLTFTATTALSAPTYDQATAQGMRDVCAAVPSPNQWASDCKTALDKLLSPSPSSTPSTTPSTTSPTPSPTPSQLTGYPNAANTGVPSGTTLISDSRCVLSVANEIINGKRFACRLSVTANGVTIKNSQLDKGIDNWSGQGSFTLQDSTVGSGSVCNTVDPFAVGATAFNVTRVKIQNTLDGFRVSGRNATRITIQDSFVKTCKASGAHSDGVQADGNIAPWTFSHNTVDIRGSATDWTASVFNGSSGSSGALTANNNLLAGGGFILQLNTTSTITNNKLVNNTWEYTPVNVSNTSCSGNSIVSIDSNYNVTGTVSALSC